MNKPNCSVHHIITKQLSFTRSLIITHHHHPQRRMSTTSCHWTFAWTFVRLQYFIRFNFNQNCVQFSLNLRTLSNHIHIVPTAKCITLRSLKMYSLRYYQVIFCDCASCDSWFLCLWIAALLDVWQLKWLLQSHRSVGHRVYFMIGKPR